MQDSYRRIRPDGEVVDAFGLSHGYWEAKDTQDDLHLEASKKFAAGYPSKNIVVQSPTHALLYQDGQLQLDIEPRRGSIAKNLTSHTSLCYNLIMILNSWNRLIFR